MKFTRNEWRLFLAVVIIIAILVLAQLAYAQDVVVVAEPLPDDIDTWAELVAYWAPKALNGVLAVLGSVVLLAMRQSVAMLPQFIREWIDAKRQRDFHSAIMSKVAELMREGRWPTGADLRDVSAALTPGLIEEIREYVVDFSPAAGRWAGVDHWTERAEKLLRTLAIRKAAELTGDPLTNALQSAGQKAISP